MSNRAEFVAGQPIPGLADTYVLERPLGGGGFGLTWRCRRKSDATAVVLKFLRLDRMDDWKALELFEREAKVLAALDHERIPTTSDYFAFADGRAFAASALPSAAVESPPRLVMVQRLVEGESLADKIAGGTRMEDAELVTVLGDVLEILEYLHGIHPPVVHRDIKPGNVIVDHEGRAHLVDFGATQAVTRRESEVGSTSVGTFGYIPLEQMMGQARPASDLYALGITVLVLATHRSPEALGFDESTGKIDVAAAAPHLPANLRHAVEGMIEPILGNRLSSAAEAIARLEGRAALVPVAKDPAAIARREPPGYLATVFNAAMGLGGVGAGVLYVGFFSAFSETELVQLSVVWLAPVTFGVFGKLAFNAGSERPLGAAFMGMGASIVALIVFIYGIFPAL